MGTLGCCQDARRQVATCARIPRNTLHIAFTLLGGERLLITQTLSARVSKHVGTATGVSKHRWLRLGTLHVILLSQFTSKLWRPGTLHVILLSQFTSKLRRLGTPHVILTFPVSKQTVAAWDSACHPAFPVYKQTVAAWDSACHPAFPVSNETVAAWDSVCHPDFPSLQANCGSAIPLRYVGFQTLG
jgi:hypothetical protein